MNSIDTTPLTEHIQVVPINGYIGAEIRGVDLRKPLADAAFDQVRRALVRYEVIVLRDQDIMLEDQIAFAQRFGALSVHPFSPNRADKPEVITFDYNADNPPALTDCWHSDETFRLAPPMATMLRAKEMPAVGGDTVFCSMTAAYRGLSERMKQYVHGLEALHDFKPFRTLFGDSAEDRRKIRDMEDRFPNPWHPVVRVHPESGRRVLYVNPQFCVRLRGLKDLESSTLLQFLYAQAQIPEYQLRVKWQPNTIVMWDNRSTQHYAPHDYYPQRRFMDRVTIAGDAVVGVSGPYTEETEPDPRFAVKPPARRTGESTRPLRPFEREAG